jgi:hypothetical protein
MCHCRGTTYFLDVPTDHLDLTIKYNHERIASMLTYQFSYVHYPGRQVVSIQRFMDYSALY